MSVLVKINLHDIINPPVIIEPMLDRVPCVGEEIFHKNEFHPEGRHYVVDTVIHYTEGNVGSYVVAKTPTAGMI